MSRSRRKFHSSDTAPSVAPTRRQRTWLRAAVFVTILTCVAAAIAYQLQPTDAASPASERQKLVGRWQRTDANYILDICSVAADGQLDAAYLNPQPIHVSKAHTAVESGKLNVMIELRDRLYPGSYYTLTYNAGDDRLSGIYHHLGVHQEYDVVFVRIGTER